jgi:hypothetical protein
VNGDNAGSFAGELAFIWGYWRGYTSYQYVTAYSVLVNTTFWTDYVPCSQGDSCSLPNVPPKRRKHPGRVDMGYMAIPDSAFSSYLGGSYLWISFSPIPSSFLPALYSFLSSSRSNPLFLLLLPTSEGQEEEVSYYDTAWYSFPDKGACKNESLMGKDNCAFYTKCALKSISKSCLEAKPGWNEADNGKSPLLPSFLPTLNLSFSTLLSHFPCELFYSLVHCNVGLPRRRGFKRWLPRCYRGVLSCLSKHNGKEEKGNLWGCHAS